MAGEMTIEGYEKLKRKFRRLIEVVDERKMETGLMNPARRLKDELSRNAPQGPTGNLKRSPVAKKFRRKIKSSPAVFVAIDRKIAPHAHLVEFGTKFMAPRSFFRKTMDSNEESIIEDIKKEAWKVIQAEAYKK